METVLLATDGSPCAEDATGAAIDLAQRLELPLLVVAVAHDEAPLYGYYGYAEITVEMRKITARHLTETLAAVKERADEAGVECETILLEGLPGEQICKVAGERGARVVVVGTHGWGRVGRLIHGSVSTYVLHHATVPVLVVRSDGERATDAKPRVTAGASA
jgi:nucleotide-binding universal stress UspA family protein